MKNFRKFSSLPVLLSAIALVLSGCAHEQKQLAKAAMPVPAKETVKPAQVNASQTPTVAQSSIDQAALTRLKQMSDTLTSAPAFSYYAKSIVELKSPVRDQLLTFSSNVEVALQRPNKLRINTAGDVPTIHLYFNDDKVSAIDLEDNVYAVSPSISSMDEMIAYVLGKAKINLPAADILNSNPYALMTKDLTYASRVGESKVNGVLCDHYAYMEPNINWEIWIQKGDEALPLRLAMTYKQADGSPHFLVDFVDWNLKPKLNSDIFTFKKPAKAVQAQFGYLQTEAAKK